MIVIAKIICGIFILVTVFIMFATIAGNKKAERITKSVNTIPKISRAYAISLITAFVVVFIVP